MPHPEVSEPRPLPAQSHKPTASEAPWLRRVVWGSWLGGGFLRLLYLFVLHPAPLHIYSDMQGYVDWSVRYFQQPDSIFDTIHTPGTPILFGALYALDPRWNLCELVQWLLSLGILGLVSFLAQRAFGRRVGVVALAITAFYFPTIHYAAFFLAENPFTFCTLLSLACFALATEAPRGRSALLYGLAAGVAAGLATSFKNAILGPFAFTGVVYALYAVRGQGRHFVAVAGGALLGLALLLVPMSMRCTRLAEGKFCLGATNTALNILMGHYGETGMFRWHDRPRNLEFFSQSPTTVLRGYAGTADFEFGAYDVDANMRTAMTWITAHPGQALVLSYRNVYDLFAMDRLWPSGVLWGIDWSVGFIRFYWLGILLPACIYLLSHARALLTLQPQARWEMLLLMPTLGMMVTVFLSVSEARYRVPFDPFMIILASQAWCVGWERLQAWRGARASAAGL